MNRRGSIASDIFAWMLCIFFLVALSYIFTVISSSYDTQNPNEGIGSRQMAVLSLYARVDGMLTYLDTAALLASYRALGDVMSNGATVFDSGCGKYASFDRWSTPDGKTCFPTSQDIDQVFAQQMRGALRSSLDHPLLPSHLSYNIVTERANGVLTIRGIAENSLTLPIILAKDAEQSHIDSLLSNGGVSTVNKDFSPDTKIPGVTTISSINKKPGNGPAKYVIIHSTRKPSVAESLYLASQGMWSVHYLIDRDGSIIQLVPESYRASHFSSCVNDPGACTISGIEELSIAIALVNSGSKEREGSQCTQGYVLLPRNDWCKSPYKTDSASCTPPPNDLLCWEEYSSAQKEALLDLLADLLRRTKEDIGKTTLDLSADRIRLSDQVFLGSDDVGPAFSQTFGEYGGFIAEVVSRSSKLSAVADVAQTEELLLSSPASGSGMDIAWASDVYSLSSCWGPRKRDTPPGVSLVMSREQVQSQNIPIHDGIDLPLVVGSNVYAIADGVVETMCKEWVGACACSSANDLSCRSRCGNNCQSVGGRGYGNFILIRHDNGLFSRYSHLSSVDVEKGDRVSSGQQIAKSGNTGNSGGPHLDLKIYDSADTESDKATNPLCFYPEAILEKVERVADVNGLNDNCIKYLSSDTPSFSHSNLALNVECGKIQPLSQASVCGVSPPTLQASAQGNPTITKTLENLQRQKSPRATTIGGIAIAEGESLLSVLTKASEAEGQDIRVVIAIVAAESVGNPDLISFSGCAGLGQFCYGTANDGAYAQIFGSGLRVCDCPGDGNCRAVQASCIDKCPSGISACVGDPRLDPFKSAVAIPKLLRQKRAHFPSADDELRFGIAAYNGGEGTIDKAIVATGQRNPSWEDVSRHVREETRGYVPRVMGFFAAQGGSAEMLFSDQRCEGITVKDLGTYEVTPAFTIEVPDLLNPILSVSTFARETYAQCIGAGDNEACLQQRVNAFNAQHKDAVLFSCGAVEREPVRIALESAIADCRLNKQDACACAWNTDVKNADIHLYQDTASVTVDGALQSPIPPFSPAVFSDSGFDTESRIAPVSLQIIDGQKRMIVWTPKETIEGENEEPFGVVLASFPVDAFYMKKTDGMIVWTPEVSTVPLCGMYKTEHHLCARIKTPILTDSGSEEPILRFSLALRDTVVPLSPSDVSVAVVGVSGVRLLGVSFSASSSSDVSYYRVSCSSLGVVGDLYEMAYAIDPLTGERRSIIERLGVVMPVTSCSGSPVAEQYTVTIVPYDISGNAGVPVVALTSKETDDGVAGLLSGVATGGITDEMILEAIGGG